jgi:DNA-binding response OmpR family regulator
MDAWNHLASGQPARLLIAHTDPQLRSLLASQFGHNGWVVHQFEDGKKLLDWLSDDLLHHGGPGRSDLIVADVRLPGRKGHELLADLRLAGWSTPFILTTKARSRYPAAKIRKHKRAFVFEAPFEIDDLVTASYYLLDRAPVDGDRRAVPRRSP